MADSKKYNGSTWEHSLRKLETKTEAVENPLYSDGTAITAYTLKGNTVQNGTPTPSNPVPVVGVGELETSGEHSGEYKIPISNGQQTTNIYLGSTQTVRAIKKLVLTGGQDELWEVAAQSTNPYFRLKVGNYNTVLQNTIISTHYIQTEIISSSTEDGIDIRNISNTGACVNVRDSTYNTVDAFKAYLAQQYANGTPVTVWYVLATPETATVNEPLMKIGTYADTLSNAMAIPTTEGANTITVDTTVQPSEFTATWTGWHDSSVKEWDGSQWS